MSGEEPKQLYVPPGFAHESADFMYKCTNLYVPEDERGIRWNDQEIQIEWPIPEPLLSPKDARFPTLKTAPREDLPR